MTSSQSYGELEIRVFPATGEGFPVEVTLDHTRELAKSVLDPAILPWPPDLPRADAGVRLRDWFFGNGAVTAAWAEARALRPQRRVRVRVDPNAAGLHVLPWEALLTPEGDAGALVAAGESTPFSRFLAGRWHPGGPVFTRPLRIAVAVANPDNLADYGLSPVDIDAERTLLADLCHGLDVELRLVDPPCTLAALEDAVRAGCHILHFVGHGLYTGDETGGVLVLADDANQVQLVTGAQVASMLARLLGDADMAQEDKLRLLFLASCRSATSSPADAFRGVAPQLVAAGVPAVIAMQDLVEEESARAFTAMLYTQLLQHGLIDLAANQARAALLTGERRGAATPVLFMRLPDGALLGQRGVITSDREELFWPFLLENINRGQCTPFLGPRVNTGLLPDQSDIAARLADKYHYPLEDRERLVRVAQFIALNDPGILRADFMRLLQRSLFSFLDIVPTDEQKRRFRNASFVETMTALDWSARVLEVREHEIHHLLADLGLPLYATTNTDNFMVAALAHAGVAPRQIGPRWQLPDAGTPQYVLTPEPSAAQPVVLHLNGFMGDPEQERAMVLSEDDYLQHIVRLTRDQDMLLPMNVLRMLSEHSFLFMGYQLEDWEFRTILQSLIKPIAGSDRARKMHVGVQLEANSSTSADEAREYLGRYLGRFNISIYWGRPQQFAAELRSRWQEYLAGDDDW
ncbi:MAG: CHAT domain-containing protein [Caldilineaceae bacterium]|nr:CHAT domain-containing protein [Caldilineaceae bacterium]